MKAITEMFEVIKNRIEQYPNWKMMYRILDFIQSKEFIHYKRAMKKLQIYPMELVDIVTNLTDLGLVEMFNTTNIAGELFSHFKITKLGYYFITYNKGK